LAANNPKTDSVFPSNSPPISASAHSSPSSPRYFNYVSVSFVKDFCSFQNADFNDEGNLSKNFDNISFYAEEINRFFQKFYYTDIILFKKINPPQKSKSESDSFTHPVDDSAVNAVLNLLFSGDFSVRYHRGVEIEAANENILHNLIRKERAKTDFLAVRSGDEKVIRAAVEAENVDFIFPVSFSPGQSGDLHMSAGPINHIVAKFAAEKKTAFCFDFFPFLHVIGSYRNKLFSDCMSMIPILRKYKVPIVLTGGAFFVYDFRGPYELEAFGRLLGLTQSETTAAVSQNPFEIAEYRRKIKSKIYLGNGVELVEENESSD